MIDAVNVVQVRVHLFTQAYGCSLQLHANSNPTTLTRDMSLATPITTKVSNCKLSKVVAKLTVVVNSDVDDKEVFIGFLFCEAPVKSDTLNPCNLSFV